MIFRPNELEPEAAACYRMLDYMNDAFKNWSDNPTDDDIERFYNMPITVSFNERCITFDNNAATFGGLQAMLEHIISEQ